MVDWNGRGVDGPRTEAVARRRVASLQQLTGRYLRPADLLQRIGESLQHSAEMALVSDRQFGTVEAGLSW